MGRGVLDPGPVLEPGRDDHQGHLRGVAGAGDGLPPGGGDAGEHRLNFSDVQQLSNTDRNYLAIAEGLGIVKGDANGMFHPDAPLTWADLATMVAEAAPRLQTL